MADDVGWSLAKRVAFRIGFVTGAIYAYPFPIGFLPKTVPWSETLLKPWNWLVQWFATSVLGQAEPVIQQTGSGDTRFAYYSFLLTVILGVIGGGVWSALDRRRVAYPRLADGAMVLLRYLLAFTMFSYGFAKIVDTQFGPPLYMQLDGRVGDMSPMGMLWTFMGSSTPYTVFGGLAEALGGALLLSRRTATLGALVVMGVMTNVVMLNFTYDVPVKLYSSQLVFLAALIALPQVRRLITAVLGGAVAAAPARPRGSKRRERIRLALKAAVIVALGLGVYQQVDESLAYRRPPGPLGGIWTVEIWSEAGVARPPLLTDGARWHKLILHGTLAQIRTLNEERQYVELTLDATAHTLTTKSFRDDKTQVWHYRQPDAEHLLLDDGGAIRVLLAREPDPLLVTRGFHWVQEFPFNR